MAATNSLFWHRCNTIYFMYSFYILPFTQKTITRAMAWGLGLAELATEVISKSTVLSNANFSPVLLLAVWKSLGSTTSSGPRIQTLTKVIEISMEYQCLSSSLLLLLAMLNYHLSCVLLRVLANWYFPVFSCRGIICLPPFLNFLFLSSMCMISFWYR